MNSKKFSQFEGMRALACIGVYLCHFSGAFFPNSKILEGIQKTPFNIMLSGNTMVRILFILSGFVVSIKYIGYKKYGSLSGDCVKRYFRLVFPLFIVNVAVYILMKEHLLFNQIVGSMTGSENFLSMFNTFEPTFKQSLYEGLWGNLFTGANGYLGPAWTMQYEMYGVLLILAVLAIFRDKALRYCFSVIYLIAFTSYYRYFVLGMLICDLYFDIEERVIKKQWVLVFLFVVSLSGTEYLENIDGNTIQSVLYSAGMIIIFLCILKCKLIGRIFSAKFLQKIGSHSYAIYLIHWPIIESFSCWFYLTIGSSRVLLILNLILSFSIILVLSTTLTKYCIIPMNILSNYIGNIIVDKKECNKAEK
ncbi:MAG: acyltransferase [Lachnospiraceae bacterium]|nr:acyltransferase [Lachnospiraceae bacterium]